MTPVSDKAEKSCNLMADREGRGREREKEREEGRSVAGVFSTMPLRVVASSPPRLRSVVVVAWRRVAWRGVACMECGVFVGDCRMGARKRTRRRRRKQEQQRDISS